MKADFEHAIHYALECLEVKLKPELTYHSLVHTTDEVVPATRQFAEMEGVRGEPLMLLITASYYHDLGYTEQHIDHEFASIRIAKDRLPLFGYSSEQIEAINGMILATRLPQSPQNLLEMILADADLEVLGSDTYMERNQHLRQELMWVSKHNYSDLEWVKSQLRFIKDHEYWTDAAKKLRNPQKRINLDQMERLLVELQG